MRKYLSFFRIRFAAGLQYRTAAWAGVVTQFAWGGMNILMFRAFYHSGINSFPMDFQALACYIWLQQAFLAMFMTWFYDNELFDSITSGGVAYELSRPCDLYTMWFVKNMAMKLVYNWVGERATSICMSNLGVVSLGGVCALSETRLLMLRNFGVKSLKELQDELGRRGVGLGMIVPGADDSRRSVRP